MMAMPVPVVAVVKKTLSIYLDYPGRIESIRSIALQARVSGYIESQPTADGADVKSGDLLAGLIPATSRPRSIRPAPRRNATRRRSTTRAPISPGAKSWSEAGS